MKRHLHLIALIFFVVSLLYDIVIWGALPLLPDVGASIVASARREAPLAATYISIGRGLDDAFPSLQAFGAQRLAGALGDGFERIRDDPTVAMDLIFGTTWNRQHRWIKTVYWAAPFFLLLFIVSWLRRPRQVSALNRHH